MDDQPPYAPAADPTALSTQALQREIRHLKELLEARVSSVEKAIIVSHEDLVRVPTDVQKQVGNLKELVNEKFLGVQQRFDERDERGKQNALDVKVGLDTALQAAKELVAQQNISAAQSAAKQEASFSKQIDAQGLLIQTTAKASDDKMQDLKDRLTRIEGKGEGRSDLWGWVIGVIGIIIAIVALWKR